ncbi:MAG TPA: CpaF family protein [Syntrophomonas sp.]|nr:CpaF family protein [Syntrophomonas sp.]HPT69020.1 CpaF family protein [Syntrophomonas sp.]
MSLSQRLQSKNNIGDQENISVPDSKPVPEEKIDKYAALKLKIHKEVIEKIDRELKQADLNESALTQKTREMVNSILEREAGFLPYSERQMIAAVVSDEVLGMGPLEPLLNDNEITEIMVNGPKQIYVERKGKLERSEAAFRDDEHVLHIIDKIVSPIGRRIDESQPMVDARLPDGSRVNAIIAPLALKGPSITIRKFSKTPYSINDLIRFGSLTMPMARLLEAAVKGRLNIFISGGTGSGKTTLLNVLASFIPDDERIITVEDAAELQLNQDHVVSLETRAANIEGKGAVTIRDLVRNCLRMRPDRIVVGEVRAGEALDMLQAMNTGHDGSLTTGHANSPRDMLARVETMVLMAGMDLPIRAIRQQITSAVDLVIQQTRMRNGRRVITHITEILGMEGDTIQMQDIFLFEQQGIDANGQLKGRHHATGITPKILNKLEAEGINLATDIFSPGN